MRSSAIRTERPLRLLVVEEIFPNFLRAFVYNAIEHALAHGAEVWVATSTVTGESEIPPSLAFGLTGKIRYLQVHSAADRVCGNAGDAGQPINSDFRAHWRHLGISG